jgi:hypothetical protein
MPVQADGTFADLIIQQGNEIQHSTIWVQNAYASRITISSDSEQENRPDRIDAFCTIIYNLRHTERSVQRTTQACSGECTDTGPQ